MNREIKKVEIEWLDSISDTNPVWQYPDNAIKNYKSSKEHFTSVGYLFYKDKKITVIANSLHYDSINVITKVGGIFTIPTGAITKIKYI